jgi:hypothetical protein
MDQSVDRECHAADWQGGGCSEEIDVGGGGWRMNVDDIISMWDLSVEVEKTRIDGTAADGLYNTQHTDFDMCHSQTVTCISLSILHSPFHHIFIFAHCVYRNLGIVDNA